MDVDTKEKAKTLEERFPELLQAPAVITARGMHYYFARSPLAVRSGAAPLWMSHRRRGMLTFSPPCQDNDGYYDSHGAVEPDVDLKTRCFTGGRGLVLVPPSSGKQWLRKPWELYPSGELPDIPDALLRAVGMPAHAPGAIRVRAAGEPSSAPGVEFTAHILGNAAYFQAKERFQRAASGGDAGSGEEQALEYTLEEGYTVDDIADLIRLAQGEDALHGESISPAEYEGHVASILKLADFLGVQEGPMAALRAQASGGGRNRADLMRVDAAWAKEVITAAKRAGRMSACTVPGDPARTLDSVDSAMAQRAKYSPILAQAPRDHRFLLPDGPRVELEPGAFTIASDPVAHAEDAMPAWVCAQLQKEAGHLALAGGAALACVSAPSEDDFQGDWDLFAYGFTGTPEEVSAQAEALRLRVTSSPEVEGGLAGCSVTRFAVTFRVMDKTRREKILVQIILRAAADPADVILAFDLPPAKVLLTCVPGEPEPKLVALAAPDWEVAMKHKAMPVDGSHFTRTGPLRILKYVAKGFDAVIPQLTDRKLIKFVIPETGWPAISSSPRMVTSGLRTALQRFDGFELLLRLEGAAKNQVKVRRLGKWWWFTKEEGPERVQMCDVQKLASLLRMEQRAEYLESLRERGVLGYVWERATRAGRVWTRRLLGMGTHPADQPLGWRQPFSPPLTRRTNAAVEDVLHLTDGHPEA